MKILAISPTYNEKKNIAELISRITLIPVEMDLLIIDDNSPDGTADIVKSYMAKNTHIFILEREKKLGLGTAYCEGFKWALDKGYDLVVQIDADLSHNPDDIPRMVEMSKSADLVIGSRYIDGVNVVNWPMRRLLLSYGANLYAQIFIRFPIKDSTGGFKCFKRDVLESIDLSKIYSEGYSFQIEMNFLTWIKGFKVLEIPIVFTDRTVGESKMNRAIVIEAILMVPKLFIKKIFKLF
ncbi:MAG: polyprenol monophosphomannose synthase [Candidatus Marinimicrobia bacterium]|nr:polyprenol monophosphomannose synthase [Candidatus Neomarinimicrobiota bacterium]